MQCDRYTTTKKTDNLIRISYRNTLSPWLPCILRHYRTFAPHSSSCCIHIQVAAVHSSLSLRIYLFAIWSTVAPIGPHFPAFAPHSRLCYTHLSLCYTQAFAAHSSMLLLHIQVLLCIHSFATLSNCATLKPIINVQTFVPHSYTCLVKLPLHE